MQSHASRHVASEFLKDLHPDLSQPFPKVVLHGATIGQARGMVPKLQGLLCCERMCRVSSAMR